MTAPSTVAVRARTSPFRFSLASAADDADARRLLRDGTVPGRISLSFQREPDLSLAAAIEGHVHETVVARDVRTGGLAGMAGLAVRTVYLNGEAVDLGCLGQLRLAGPSRLRSLIDEGLRFVRERDRLSPVPGYLVSLVDGNAAARRLLIDRVSTAMPRFVPAGRLTTFALPVRAARTDPSGAAVALRFARADDVEEIARCLRRNLVRFQFAPVWTSELLRSAERCRGLEVADFVIAERAGRVIGCAALWDQRAFKQVVVRGYDPSVARSRWLINGAASWLGTPRLPPVGHPLAFAYVSHLAVDDDDPAIVREILTVLSSRAAQSGLDHLVVGAPEGHPLCDGIAATGPHQTYGSELFLAAWPDGRAPARSLDGRPPNPEVAIL